MQMKIQRIIQIKQINDINFKFRGNKQLKDNSKILKMSALKRLLIKYVSGICILMMCTYFMIDKS